MKKHYIYLFFLTIFCLLRCNNNPKSGLKENVVNNGKIESFKKIRDRLFNSVTDTIIIVAHRGDWRNAPENSLQAIQNCIDMGIDMVEIDVQMTKDQELVVIHDRTLDRTTTGKGLVAEWTLDSLKTLYLKNGAGHNTHHKIPTLEEAMLSAKGKIMVNLDKCYDYFDKVYQILKKTGTEDHVVMKGKVTSKEVQEEFGDYLDKVVFMPVIDLNDINAKQMISDYQNTISPVAFEFTFNNLNSGILHEFREIREKGSRIWVNTLWETLNAGYEDDMAIHNSDSIYGWHIKKGVNMIQTDRPNLLLNYLRKEGLHK